MRKPELSAAERLLESGAHDKAIQQFRQLLAEKPSDPLLRGRLAEAYFQSGNRERAFYHFDQAARILGAMGREALAADYLERADNVHPNEPEILFRLAQCYEGLGRQAPLLATCDRLEQCAKAQGDRRRQWALERMVRHRPEELDRAHELAQLLLQAGRGERAADIYQDLVERYVRAEKDPAPLLAELEANLEEYPALARPQAAIAFAQQGAKAALELLQPLAEQTPNAIPVLELLTKFYAELDEVELQREARLRLAAALVDAERGPEALAALEPLLVEEKPRAEVVQIAARSLAAAGEEERASELWAEVIKYHHAADSASKRDRAILEMLRTTPNGVVGLRAAVAVLQQTGRATQAEALERRLRTLEPAARDAGPVTKKSQYGRGLALGAPLRRPVDVAEPVEAFEEEEVSIAMDTVDLIDPDEAV